MFNYMNLEKALVFGLWLWLHNKASLRSVRTSQLRSEDFPVWTSQLVNKSIIFVLTFKAYTFGPYALNVRTSVSRIDRDLG